MRRALVAVMDEAARLGPTEAWTACSGASRTKSVRSDADTRQPTVRRAKTSITKATYTKPAACGGANMV